MSEKVTIEVSDAEIAELGEWARNSEQSVEALLQEALQRYLAAVRADHADLDERMKGPFYPLEEVEARLAERRRRFRSEAAE
jgi:predicted transcriptional regulator